MAQSEVFVGIDVGKNELVIHQHPAGAAWRVTTSKSGLAKLGRQLVKLAATADLRIGFEATGGYERPLGRLLARLGLTAYLLDPSRVRSFARAERQIAKTDPLDAAVIARCLAAIHNELTPYVHDEQAIELAEHVRLRDLFVLQIGQLRNQLEREPQGLLKRMITQQIARLKASILTIEKAMAALIGANPALADRERLLRSAPGVGPIVAATLIAKMPELGRVSSRQIAALAGVAPFDRQSGTRTRKSQCSGGRSSVRRALYLAALCVTRTGKGPLARTYERLRENGKAPKLALMAIMRKMIVMLNAMVQQGRLYDPA